MRPFGPYRLGLLLLFACGHAPKVWEPFDLKKPSAAPGAVRVVLLSSKEVRFSVDPKTQAAVADETVHMRVKAMQPHALDSFVVVAFDRTFRARPTIAARVLFPDGTTRDLDPDEQWEHPIWPRHLLYVDARALSQPVPAVPAGGVLEYETTQRSTDLKPLQFGFALGDDDPLVQASFSVVAPDTWELEWVAIAGGERVAAEPTVDTAGPGLKRWRWEKKDVPPFVREPSGVDAMSQVPVVAVRLKKWVDHGQPQTAFASPRELSAWLYEQTKNLSAPDPAMRETVQQVLQGSPEDPREKARRLYDYACEKVQYCAIEIGYGGWFPHPAADVQQNKYGDCKDKANYLKGLLALAGIPSRSTLIYNHQGLPKPFGLPSLAANFNHAILTVDLPQGPLLVDPTARAVAFGDLPIGDREASVLPIADGGADLGTAPTALPADHQGQETWALALKDDGSASGTLTLNVTGALAADLRTRLLTSMPVKHHEVISDWLRLHDVNLTDVTGTTGFGVSEALEVKGKLELPRLMLSGPTVRAVRLAAFVPQWLPALEAHARHSPVVLPTRFTRRSTVRLQLPAGLKVKQLPAAVTQSTKWLDYRLAFRAEGDAVVAEREAVLKERIVPPGEVGELRAALDAVHLAENQAVLLGAP